MHIESVCLLIPYFGKFPDWAPLYFETLKKNKTIDFIFYTDCDPKEFTAPNVQFISIGFDEYISLVREKTGVDFKPANPYKLCDLRPLYPLVHAEDIKN
ncbi:MAG: DUF6625 family protein, partial [Cyclobacteriaceae bacterium]